MNHMKRRITENLDLDLEKLQWMCHGCGHELGPAKENFKRGCLISQRSPHEVWRPMVEGEHSFSFNPGWARLVEFYCPSCALMIDVELLPPGHPITHDIDLDLDALVAKARAGQTGDRS
jgi:acetophenone carboxylase